MTCQKVLWLTSRTTLFAVIGNNSLYCSPGRYVQRGRLVLTFKCMLWVVKRRVNWGEKSRFSISSSLEGSWEHGAVPGTQQDPLCVLNRSAPSWEPTWDITSPSRWGEHQAGEVAPPDLSWGQLLSGEESMSQGWERRRSGGAGAVQRPGPCHSGGASAEVSVQTPIAIAGSEWRGDRREETRGSRYMAVVITFSSGSTVFS